MRFEFSQAVTLVGNGRIFSGDIESTRSLAPVLIAADGGLIHLLGAGYNPTAIIGDLDSIEQSAECVAFKNRYPERFHRIAEQDSTDFEKCLHSISAPFVLAVGFTGMRIDHELANFNALAKWAQRPCFLIGEYDVCCLAPLRMELDLPQGTRISLFPLAPVQGQSRGLRWEIEGIAFAPNGSIGTSNRTVGERVELEFSERGMLIFLPRECLASVLEGVLESSVLG